MKWALLFVLIGIILIGFSGWLAGLKKMIRHYAGLRK